MFKYLFPVLLVLCGIYLYLNYPSTSKDHGSIKVGEVFYVRVMGGKNLSAFLKRISPTQVLFSFIRDGEQPQVDANPEDAFNLGGEILVSGGACRIRFESMETSYKGYLACDDLKEQKFRAFLQLSKEDEKTLQFSEDVRAQTGEVLAKIEGLSDEILNKTFEMTDDERMIRAFKEGELYGSDVDTKQTIGVKKPVVGRGSFLRASNEGQEIYLASRLLDEEAKVLLKLQKYSAKGEDVGVVDPDAVDMPVGQDRNPLPSQANTGGQWWKELD